MCELCREVTLRIPAKSRVAECPSTRPRFKIARSSLQLDHCGMIMRVCFCVAVLCAASLPIFGGDQRQFGEAWSRNMVSKERGLPSVIGLETGRNVKWI